VNRKVGKNPAAFGDHRHPPSDHLMGGQALKVAAFQKDAAFLARHQSGDGLDGGGLAGAIGPQQGHQGALGDAQTDAIQGLDGPVGYFEIKDF
jgi:hypothetical protein